MQQDEIGMFEIKRVSNDISFDDFYHNYFEPEIPVIIEGVSRDWLATKKWNPDYLRQQISKEQSIKDAALWYHCDYGFLEQDYQTPELIGKLINHPNSFERKECFRLWMNSRGNVSDWHYDTNLVSVFNVQVIGEKHWYIISPDTPLTCYPFSHIALLQEDNEALKDKRYASFSTKQGDMLYLPPLWVHKVTSVEDENINVNWVITKKSTAVVSKSLQREIEVAAINDYFDTRKPFLLNFLYQSWLNALKPFAHITWIFDKPIKAQHAKLNLKKRFFLEFSNFLKTILDAKKLLSKSKKLERTNPELKKEQLEI